MVLTLCWQGRSEIEDQLPEVLMILARQQLSFGGVMAAGATDPVDGNDKFVLARWACRADGQHLVGDLRPDGIGVHSEGDGHGLSDVTVDGMVARDRDIHDRRWCPTLAEAQHALQFGIQLGVLATVQVHLVDVAAFLHHRIPGDRSAYVQPLDQRLAEARVQ